MNETIFQVVNIMSFTYIPNQDFTEFKEFKGKCIYLEI